MDSSTLKLIMEKGPREGEVLEFNTITRSLIKVGRVVRGNTVSIKDNGISSKHLSICFTADKWVITDLESSNGTQLNSTSLEPLTTYDLQDGDVIKIGECTSVRVLIVRDSSGVQLRRSSRRRGAPEHPQEKGLGESVAAERGVAKRGVKGSTRENVATGIESDAETKSSSFEPGQENVPGVLVGKEEKRRGRGRPRKACNLKDGNSDDLVVPVSSDAVLVIPENAKDVKPRRRPGPRKKDDVSLKREEVMGKDLKISEMKNTDAPPQRGLRSRKKKDSMNMLSSELEIIKEVETAEAEKLVEKEENVQVQNMWSGRKKNEQGAPPDTAGFSSVGKEDRTKEMSKSDELCKHLIDGFDGKDGQGGSQSQLNEEAMNKNNADSGKPTDYTETRGLASEELECGLTGEFEGMTSQETGVNSAHREKDSEACESLDLAKMTLGEWFDYLERYLPKQINAVTVQVIADLRKRSQQYHEFIQQLQKEEGDI